ncbi:D-alanyl-D-alanine-carboxypeptidase/endopeptidase AmpH [Amaricoccus sp. W119]|uniref:D-alanyl-D-alanine- carboxypeptidase/endopeptidase AmpH n=1 Tax=Amaricoccus sp. W119 TaxID=3391833 RepID=UPI0039A56052
MRRKMLTGLLLGLVLGSGGAGRADPLLEEMVGFDGVVASLSVSAPAFVLGAIRNGETAVQGFGDRGDGKPPDGDTLFRIGSVSKVFCGSALARLVADGQVALTDTLESRAGFDGVTFPERDGAAIRLIDLVTHSAGLPREVPAQPGPPDDPFAGNTPEAQRAGLSAPLLFTPARGMRYSNYGFDLLGTAIAHTAGRPYADYLAEHVLTPNGMSDTTFSPSPEQEPRLMRGHDFSGAPMPFAPTPVTIECAGGLYSTPNDMLRWLSWQLDLASDEDAEWRLLGQAAWRQRDGLAPVSGLDEGGEMGAMGLAWVIMPPEGNRPLIMQKSGGLQGIFSFVAMAPGRGVAVFGAINQFDVAGFPVLVETVTDLVAALAPR